jgi:hypothetical protein
LPPETSYIFRNTIVCDFCNVYHKDNCIFAFEDDVKLQNILDLMKYERELELTINWKQNIKVNIEAIENSKFVKINLSAPSDKVNSL